MSEHERERPGRPGTGGSVPEGGGGDRLESARARTADLLRAADAAIGRVLSADSVNALHAHRQQGGQ